MDYTFDAILHEIPENGGAYVIFPWDIRKEFGKGRVKVNATFYKGKNVRKTLHVIITIFIMLVVSRFAIRLVDATVQIDDDIGLLILLLVILNACIAGLSLYVFRR